MRKTGFLILTNPPLVDLASQIQPNRIRHFFGKIVFFTCSVVGGGQESSNGQKLVVGTAGKSPFAVRWFPPSSPEIYPY